MCSFSRFLLGLCRIKFAETKKNYTPNAKQRGKLIEHFSNSLHSHRLIDVFENSYFVVVGHLFCSPLSRISFCLVFPSPPNASRCQRDGRKVVGGAIATDFHPQKKKRSKSDIFGPCNSFLRKSSF